MPSGWYEVPHQPAMDWWPIFILAALLLLLPMCLSSVCLTRSPSVCATVLVRVCLRVRMSVVCTSQVDPWVAACLLRAGRQR